jgi:hypothetical protein
VNPDPKRWRVAIRNTTGKFLNILLRAHPRSIAGSEKGIKKMRGSKFFQFWLNQPKILDPYPDSVNPDPKPRRVAIRNTTGKFLNILLRAHPRTIAGSEK